MILGQNCKAEKLKKILCKNHFKTDPLWYGFKSGSKKPIPKSEHNPVVAVVLLP